MTQDEFLRKLASSGVSQKANPPLDDRELDAWQRSHPKLSLPQDLIAFLRIANGIQIDLRAGPSGYFALLPLRDYGVLRRVLYGTHVDDNPSNAYLKEQWPDHTLAISRHADGTQLLALDTQTGEFLDADAYDSPRVISRNLPAVFDWLGEHWLEPLVDKTN
jgi:hypothetical protein